MQSLHFLPDGMSVKFFSLMKNLKSETMLKKNICFKGDTLKTTTGGFLYDLVQRRADKIQLAGPYRNKYIAFFFEKLVFWEKFFGKKTKKNSGRGRSYVLRSLWTL